MEAQQNITPSYQIKKNKIEPIPFIIATDTAVTPKPKRIDNWPDQVIFGNAPELINKIFPNTDLFIEQHNAPRSWVYEWLTGRAKVVLPRINGYSDEAVSLIASRANQSVYHAMLKKRRADNKWVRLNLFYENNFKFYFDNKQREQRIPLIRG